MANATNDATKIHSGIKGLGTDNATLIKILTSRTNEYLQEVGREYARLFGKSLFEDVRDDTSGPYQDVLVALVRPRAEYMAHTLRDAMKGVGTNERMITNVLVIATNEEIQQIKAIYAAQLKRDLEKDLKAEVSGNYLECALSLLEGNRNEGPATAQAQQDADELYKKGEGIPGTDDKFFINFFTKSSPAHIGAVNVAYNAAHGHPLPAALKKETSGDYRELLTALAIPRLQYFAQRIRASIKGLGTNDAELIFCFVLNAEFLLEIREIYWRLYNVHMEDDIRGDTSGNYQITLMCLLKKKVVKEGRCC